MEIHFHEDPDTGLPHIYSHDVTEEEVRQVLVPDRDPESVFLITAYELRGKAKTAYRRRQRRKPG